MLSNQQEYQKLRTEREFTLEKLQEEKGINLQDCKKLFSYAKVLYEKGEYKSKIFNHFSLKIPFWFIAAEKNLFALKEILISE